MIMDYDTNDGDVFAIPNLYGPSKLLSEAQGSSSLLFSQLKLDDARLPDVVEQPHQDDIFSSIPDFSCTPSETVPTPTHSTEESGLIPNSLESDEETDDIWTLPEAETPDPACYQSWDAFSNRAFEEPPTAYITEAGRTIFDTAVATKGAFLPIENSDYIVVDHKTYASSLHALGLGRSSVFFEWVEEKKTFQPTLQHMRISSYSGEALSRLVVMFLECGNITKLLRRFVYNAYSRTPSPGQVALADAVSTLLEIIELRLSTPSSDHKSILQLQALFLPSHAILTCFQRIVRNVSTLRNDEAMLSTVFEEIQLSEHKPASLKAILLEILCRVSKPWLEFVGEWLGLQREAGLPLTKEGIGKGFVKIANNEWVDEHGIQLQEADYALDYDKVPSFIAPEDARSMFEVGRSLRFLRVHHPQHPLARAEFINLAKPPTLHWKFSWQDVLQLEARALQYEKDLSSAIQQFSRNEQSVNGPIENVSYEVEDQVFNLFGKQSNDIEAHIMASIITMNQPLERKALPDELSILLDVYLAAKDETARDSESIFSFPVSLSPVLSFNPVIATQARIVNRTCMRMFFTSHKLREHLNLQRSFHLLGNGVFSSRLSHALFDPDVKSAERQRGVARSGGVMGLRLGGRDTWPPASSELRLALMGVLTESYVPSQTLNRSRSTGTLRAQPSLPGDLSFAVHDMAEEEIERCMNADSIEALDFLRLSYKPPSPLDAVISPMILFKYDKLFKLLLRVVRMLYVVSTLFSDQRDRSSHRKDISHIAQRFRVESHHFITSISGYFFESGIETTWRAFERKLDQIEKRLNSDDKNVIGQDDSLDKLRDYHESVLDKIMFSLFLRKRQQPVLKLLEEIFTVILQFSKLSRQRALGVEEQSGTDEEMRELYLKYRKKIGVFITVCRGLSEKKGYADKGPTGLKSSGGLFDGHDLVEENTVGQLLVRLEISSYYSKVAPA